jgi:hypothetical protein
MTNVWRLVWTYGTANRPEPQLWADFAYDLTYATNRNKIISARRLTDEEVATLSLYELAKKYPLPEMAE